MRPGSFQILKRLFSDKADTIPHLTNSDMARTMELRWFSD
jgi:hypothetical protein